MEVVLLGTSSMVPTEDRNHSSALLSYKNENILIDCGEGTQRQIRKAKLSAMKITKILITHWHGDHVLGLPGLFLTLGAQGYDKELEIYGPKGSKVYLEYMMNMFNSRDAVKYKLVEIENGKFFENDEFFLEAVKLKHHGNTLGYSFNEKDKRRLYMDKLKKIGVKEGPILKKLQNGEDIIINDKKIKVKDYTYLVTGKKVTFITDTLKCDEAVNLAKNSNYLFCESSFLEEQKDLAIERKHMTALQSGEIAKKAKIEHLVLMHYSQRYKDINMFEKEAKKVFKNTVAGKDFMKFEI